MNQSIGSCAPSPYAQLYPRNTFSTFHRSILNNSNMDFKTFFNLLESYDDDLKKTLGKIPKSHKALADQFKFVFQPGNELKGDGEHIGIIDKDKKTITVAAPWNYGREYTVLHEIGHLVWEVLMDEDLKKQWAGIYKNTKDKQKNQNEEELFCMAYANHYANHKVVVHTHDTWEKFIKGLPS